MTANARSWRLSLVLSLLGIARVASAQLEPPRESDLQRRLRETYTAAATAEKARDWPEAERRYRRLVTALPGNWPTRIAMARICAQTNRAAEAVQWLDKAVELGLIDSKLIETQGELGLLRGRDDYEAVRRKADRYQTDTPAVYVPPRFDRTKPRTVVIAFHGRGGNEREQIAQWRDTADKLGLVVVAPRGPRTFRGRYSFGWDDPNTLGATGVVTVDVRNTARLADAALQRMADAGPTDPNHIVLAGHSQGGGVALQLALFDPARFSHVLMLNPTYESPTDAAVWERAREARLRVRIISGELDPLGPNAQAAHAALARAGVDVRMTIVPDVGHEAPPDLSARQADALEELLR